MPPWHDSVPVGRRERRRERRRARSCKKEEKPDSFHGVDSRAVDGPYYPEAAFPNQARISIRPTAPAWGAEVVSSNIVGYHKLDLSAGLNLIGSQFLSVGGEDKDIQELIVDDGGLAGLDENLLPQTELRVWTGTGYRTYGWDPDGDPSVPGSDHKWVDGDLNVVTVDVPAGFSAWISSPSVKTVTFAGEVVDGDTATQTIAGGLALLASPFPEATNLQSIQLDNSFPGLDENLLPQTELRVWTGTGYRTYGWDPDGDPSVPGSDHKWVDGDLNVVNVSIPMGNGFWIKSASGGTVTFSK